VPELIVRIADREERVEIDSSAPGLRIRVGERWYDVDRAGPDGCWSLVVAGQQREVSVVERGPAPGASGSGSSRYLVGVGVDQIDVELLEPLAYLAELEASDRGVQGPSVTRAYMPGRVVAVLVAEGDVVTRGQGVLVLEAMKMENEIPAESDGVIKKLFVTAGQPVEGGDPLFEVSAPEG
jgi:biotin carboxyl carrier protein